MSVFFHNDIKGIINKCPITSIFILANCLFFIYTILTGGFTTINLYRLGGLISFAVLNGEYYRFLTAMFLHGSIMHFIFNIFFGLLILGAGLEKVIGSVKFFFIYMLSGLISGYSVVMFSRALTVGASGAIFGVLGALIYIALYKKHLLSYTDRVYVRNLLLINLFFTVITPFISISGHVGGLIGGFLLSFIFLSRL